MASLVEEIQREALDTRTSITTLLRKVKLAAAKLRLSEIEAWVDNELNGYFNKDVPPYRKARGIPKAHNPFNGWIPIMDRDGSLIELISQVKLRQAISAIEDLLTNGDGDSFQVPLPPKLISQLNAQAGFEFGEMVNFIGRGALVNVIDQVRTKVLDWAIELEKSGIKGNGISFNAEEIQAAKNNAGINIGSVGTLVGVIGNQNQVNDIVGGNLNTSEVRRLAQQLEINLPELVSSGANEDFLSPTIQKLLNETEKPDPSKKAINGLLGDLRTALAGATGNLMATGALSMINSILGA
ncbi:hypothetical protein SAMN04488518_106241 [Pseudovibrio ascidiaceicola]|uniref:AbiTii domain-containing protein n=1 Tax=Pseudovibrio ascidiaceicola TaxID=285279 RepID=A0A1I4AJ17_9HYPH|nr:hypothetical protein [Pseudovibrio ascidiaceicola]SFK56458.1 hypothetical protein SAMN04488518_106241 [Pseudovibrio ascidiaceicola]